MVLGRPVDSHEAVPITANEGKVLTSVDWGAFAPFAQRVTCRDATSTNVNLNLGWRNSISLEIEPDQGDDAEFGKLLESAAHKVLNATGIATATTCAEFAFMSFPATKK